MGIRDFLFIFRKRGFGSLQDISRVKGLGENMDLTKFYSKNIQSVEPKI